jgi:intracellular septation protein
VSADGGIDPQRRSARHPPRWFGPAIDCAPLTVFFCGYAGWDIFIATAAMLVATALALGLSFAWTRHVPLTALVSATLLGIFGGLTLWLNDPAYLKLQSTLISSLFSLALFAALALRRDPLRRLFGATLPLDSEGWRMLTVRTAFFFAALAGLNELIARTQSTDIWVDFNVFGATLLGAIFAAAQLPVIKRHRTRGAVSDDKSRGGPNRPATG